jgi:hypothetical protein
MITISRDKVTIDCWNYGAKPLPGDKAVITMNKIAHPAWSNLVDSLDPDLEYGDYCMAIAGVLKKYNAKMIRPETFPHYMRFPNEKMAMWFLLEWA